MKTKDVIPFGPLKWEEHAVPNADGRNNHTATLVGGKLYIFGGYTEGNRRNHNDLLVVEKTKTGYRQTKLTRISGKLPPKRNGHTTNLVNERLYVFGGWLSNGVVSSDIFVFDLALREWSFLETYGRKHPMMNKHISHYVQGLDLVMHFGGGDGRHFENSVNCLRMGSLTWEEWRPSGVPPAPRANAKSCMAGHTCYIFGGWNPVDRRFQDIHLLIMPSFGEKPRWSSPVLTNLPDKRVGGCLAYFRERILLFGGQNYKDYNDIHVLDLNFMMWHEAAVKSRLRDMFLKQSFDFIEVSGNFPSKRGCHTVTVMPSGDLLVYGGKGAQGTARSVHTLTAPIE